MMSYAAASWRLLRALRISNHRLIKITLWQRPERPNRIDTRRLWLTMHSGVARKAHHAAVGKHLSLCGNEKFKQRPDVVTQHEVGDVVELGFIAVDNDEPRTIALGQHRKA